MVGTCFCKAAAAFVISAVIFVGGCSFHKEPESVQGPVYGVANLETLVKAHPKYSEYFRLETEYNQQLQQYQAEKKNLIDSSAKQKKIRLALEDESRRLSAETEWKTRVKAKENELNQRLEKLYNSIRDRHHQTDSRYMDPLTPEERAEMANLQMQLTVLGVSGEEKEKIKGRLHELLQIRMERETGNMIGWSDEEVRQMKDAKEKASAELEDFSAKTAQEIKDRLAGEQEQKLLNLQESDDEANQAWSDSWQKKIEFKQKQMANIKEEIMEDIRKESAVVASEQHLAMIFTNYRANVQAKDVTGDIATKIVNIDR